MAGKLYAGPAKVVVGTKGLFPEGENGQVQAVIAQESDAIATGMYGHIGEQQANAEAKITLTPFDHWDLLSLFFPPWLGVKVGATAAALVIGTRPHDTLLATKIWTPDGRLYSFPRTAVVEPPSLTLGVGQPLYGQVGIAAIGDAAKQLGDAGFLYTITETAGVDPGGQFAMTDFVRGRWTGVWGTAAGFGGGVGDDPIEAEDFWRIETEAKFSKLTVGKLCRGYKLDSVRFMTKVRPYGPTHTQIDAATGINAGRKLGDRFAATGADLVLTGPGNKTITQKAADVKGAGYEFGGTRLGTGEIGFVSEMKFTGGAPTALLEFSA